MFSRPNKIGGAYYANWSRLISPRHPLFLVFFSFFLKRKAEFQDSSMRPIFISSSAFAGGTCFRSFRFILSGLIGALAAATLLRTHLGQLKPENLFPGAKPTPHQTTLFHFSFFLSLLCSRVRLFARAEQTRIRSHASSQPSSPPRST